MTETPPKPAIDQLPASVLGDLRTALLGAIAAYEPLRLHIVEVRDWFGPNWLRFEGKIVGAAGVHSREREPLIVPPFHPNRIREALWFERDAPRQLWVAVEHPPLNIRQTSAANLCRPFDRVAGPRTVAIWLGGELDALRCALLYASRDGDAAAWYADVHAGTEQLQPTLAGLTPAEFALFQRTHSPKTSDGTD